MKKVLNVGGNSKAIPLPPQYAGFDHVLLDIDPTPHFPEPPLDILF